MSEHRLTREQAAEILSRQFPELRVAAVEWLGAGLDSTAFEVNGEWVFRFPARAEIVAQMLLENRTLPIIAHAVNLSVPDFEWMGGPCAIFPFFFAGYAKLPGSPTLSSAPRPGWGTQLGSFLRRLHALKPAKVLRLKAPVIEAGNRMMDAQDGALEDLAFLADAAAQTLPSGDWVALLEAMPVGSGGEPLVVTHGDLGAEHILHDEDSGDLTGVIDWSELSISDRAVDIAAVFHWTDHSLVNELVAAYGAGLDEHVMQRAAYYALCRGVADIRFGVETERREYVEAGMRRMEFYAALRS